MSPLVLSLTVTGIYSSAHVTFSSIFHIHRNLLFSASIHVSLALTFTGTTLFISLFSSISNIHRNFLYSFQSLAQSLTFAGITSVHFSLLNSHQLFQSHQLYVSLYFCGWVWLLASGNEHSAEEQTCLHAANHLIIIAMTDLNDEADADTAGGGHNFGRVGDEDEEGRQNSLCKAVHFVGQLLCHVPATQSGSCPQFTSLQFKMVSMHSEKAHTCSTPSLTSLPNTALEMVPMFVWTSHPHSVKVHSHTHSVKVHKSVCQPQFSSRWYLCMQKSPNVLHHIFKKIAWSCLWKSSSVHLTDNGPFLSFQGRSFGWVLLYVHKNCRLMRDGSLGRPPQLSHSSWPLKEDHWVLSSICASLLQVIHGVVSWLCARSLCVSTSLTFHIFQDARHLWWLLCP